MGHSQYCIFIGRLQNNVFIEIGCRAWSTADPELVAQEDITWEEFSRIMTEVFGQQVTEHEIRAEIETHTRLNSSGPDTISFI